MSKELECLKKLGTHRIEYREGFELGFTKTMPFKSTMEYKTIEQALQHLNEYDNLIKEYDIKPTEIREAFVFYKMKINDYNNANPSEALEIVDKMANYILLDEKYGFIDDEEKQAIIKDRDTIKQALIKAQEQEKENKVLKAKTEKQEKILNTIFQNIELDENYSELCSGSTKAYKLVIPNCISVEEDENYTDDCFPNLDFVVIDDFVKEKKENE